MWSPGSPPDSLPAAPQLSGELRPRQAVARLTEGEIAVHLLAREILPCPCEFQERAARSGEPSHDLAEALSLPLKGSQGSIRIFGEGHGLHGHLCVLISTHVYECSAVIVRVASHTISSIISSSPFGLSAIRFPRSVAQYRVVPGASAAFTKVFVPDGSRARASSRTRLSSSSMICAGRTALNSEKSSFFAAPRFPRPAMNSRIRWRNTRLLRLALPFARMASTDREMIVEKASSTPWPVRALVMNVGAVGNSFRSQAVSSGPIAIASARSILLKALPTGTGPGLFATTSIQSLIRCRVSGRSTSHTARTP